MIAATVLIPTFDHGPTIRYALESALAQTVRDIEILVVGDGAPQITRDVVVELAGRDSRIRFFDNAKGPHHGEIHRHAALAQAQGRVVAYLADDDLWFGDHLETMLGLLETADLATAVCVRIDPADRLALYAPDLANLEHRRELLTGHRAIPLSSAAHTLEAYRRLPGGWRTTPPTLRIDREFWEQFVEDESCTATAARHVTVLNFAAKHRKAMSVADRAAELEAWWARLGEPRLRDELSIAVAKQALADLGQLKVRFAELKRTRG